MKEKILAELVKKHPGLSKAFLGFLADKMATKITEESGIDAAIAELDNATIPITDLASEFQREGDRRVTTAKKEWEKKNPPKSEKQEEKPPTEETEDKDTPGYVKTLMKGIETLTKEVATIKGEKLQETYTSKAKVDLKDVPLIAWEGRPIPQTEEAYTAFVAQVKEAYTKHVQEATDKGLAVIGTPKGGNGGEDNKKASKEEVAAIVDNIM